MTSVIGIVHPINPADARCVSCVDFMGADRLIWKGEEFTCTYCKREFSSQEDEWSEPVTPEETSILIASTLVCDCNACQPKNYCEHCSEELTDDVCLVCLSSPAPADPEEKMVDMGDVELTSCITCDRGVDVYKGNEHVGHLYPFSTRKRHAVRLSENCGIGGKPELIWDKFSDDPYEALMVGVEALIETI